MTLQPANHESSQEALPALLKVKQLLAQGMKTAIDLQLKAHDICMLSGTSGSGKSQFLKAIADLIEQDGEVLLAGKNMQEIAAPTWRQQVMYFSAETAWWSDVVSEHFNALPNKEQLKKVALSVDILSVNPDTLSSGEKQRLALLRGLQYAPKVLLLDEITANLDPTSEKLVEDLVKAYIQEHSAAAIWISHDPEQSQRLQTQSLVFQAGAVS